VKRRYFRGRKFLILFDSKVLTIKSIYRKKIAKEKYIVFLHFNETNEPYSCITNNIGLLKGLKKGDLVTLHVGNGGYVSIEKGDTIKQDGSIRCCVV